MEHFIELFEDTMETDGELSAETVFRDAIDDFSSMDGFSIIVMIEEEYGVRLSVDDFLSFETIEDLYNKCKQ